MKTTIEIGTAYLMFDDKGVIESANFVPTMKIDLNREDLKRLTDELSPNESDDIIKLNANKAFAAWFQQTNRIELADREKFEIVTEIVGCTRNAFGGIISCTIRYSFNER